MSLEYWLTKENFICDIMPQYYSKRGVHGWSRNIYRNAYKDTTKEFSLTGHLFHMWKGSCYKLLWPNVSLWLFLYILLSIIYHFIIFDDPRSRQMFEIICIYCGRFSNLIPITFLTGFYVNQVVSRWWDQFMSLPWPDQLAIKLVNFCPGAVIKFRDSKKAIKIWKNISLFA